MNRPSKAALTLALAAASPSSAAAARTVLVDVGHSLAAQGSTSASGVGEFRYNRALALDLAAEMRRRGWRVLVPNADGRTSSLAARPAAARAAAADLLISIHHDSVQAWQMPSSRSFSGFSTWASGSHPRASESTRCAGLIGRSMAAAGMRPNLSHAARVPGESRDLRDPQAGRYRRDDLAVLRLSRTPAVLVEAGVIANPDEEAWLARPETRRGIAAAIAAGADSCVRDRGDAN